MKSVVIVGNGPSCLEEKNGHVIDRFDEVVRFNEYQTEGWEEYVGTKTDTWVGFRWRGELKANRIIWAGVAAVTGDPKAWDRYERVKRAAQKAGKRAERLLETAIRRAFWILDQDIKGEQKPTTGFATIIQYLYYGHSDDEIDTIAITGFDGSGEKGWYWRKQAMSTHFQTVHDFPKELSCLRALSSAGLLFWL